MSTMSTKRTIGILRCLAHHGIMSKQDLIKECGLTDERELNTGFMNLMIENGFVTEGIGNGRHMITEKGLAWLYYFDKLNNAVEQSQTKNEIPESIKDVTEKYGK